MTKLPLLIRLTGSKWKHTEQFANLMNINKDSVFVDVFGGSLCLSYNIKYLFNCRVICNDFDNNYPFKKAKVLANNCCFNGVKNQFTEQAVLQCAKKIKNGLIANIEKVNQVLSSCEVLHCDYKKVLKKCLNLSNAIIYLDPPYQVKNNRVWYKEAFTWKQHLELNKCLNMLRQATNNKIFISYNNSPEIKKLYKDWNIKELDFTYTHQAKLPKFTSKVKELWISN